MAGVYIHIPFCKQACVYCNFHFSTNLELKSTIVSAIMKELEQRKDFLPNDPIETIYFGGGTPSLLTTIELTSILSSIYESYEVKTNAEITIEANPDDISLSFSKELKHIGFNRMSLGIQSFLERDMKYMHRAHTPSQSHHAIDAAQEAGFENISIDLIYGIPNTNLNDWKNNLDIIAAKNVQHLSCYALTVEPDTALAYQIKSHPQLEPKDADTILQLEYLIHHCKDYGFEQYEISNFSKPGFKSRHNNNYWQGVYYLGLGPSAHSYNGISR
ncbi:MAG: radical SAM family heme chaperone HemW, partial [Saprospiraceae bacterium]